MIPPAAKVTGLYVNSSLAKVEALKAGYDEAILLNTQGYVSECTGENIFVVKGGRIITPPLAAGALDGITRDSIMVIARDLGYEVVEENILRSDLYIADEAFLTGTAAEVVPIRAVDDRVIGEPGEVTRKIQEMYFATIRGEVETYKGWLEHVRCPIETTSWPERVEIFDTTLRDGSQREGISLTVADKLKVAEQLDHLGVDYIEGGWPGANPKDEEFFRRAPAELRLEHSQLVAFGSTRRAGVKADDDEVLRNLVKAGTPVVCIVAKSWDYHVTEALRTTLDEAVAMVGDSVEFLRNAGARGVPRRRALLRRLPPQPRVRPPRAAGRPRGRRRPARAVRHQRRHPAPRGGADRGRGPGRAARRRARRPLPQRHRLRGGQRPGRRPSGRRPDPGLHQRLRRADGQRQPDVDHPQPHAEDGDRDGAPGPAGAADPRLPPHRRAGQPHARPPVALRGHQRLRPQGRAPHQRHLPGSRRLRARRARRHRQPDPLRGLRAGRPVDRGHAGQGARPRPLRRHGHRRARAAEDAGARRLPLRGGRRLLRAAAAHRRRLAAGASSPWRASG